MKSEVTPVQRMLNVWAIVLIIWSLYRVYFKTDLPIWFDEFIAKPLIFLAPVYYYITHYEKKEFLKAVDLRTKNWRSGIVFGLIAGALFFVTGLIVQVVQREEVQISFANGAPGVILFYLAISVATSISEEILSRGFVLKRLYADSKNLFKSVFFASFLFFFLHIPILMTNPEFKGVVLLQVMVTDILLSFAVSFLYLQKKSLFIPILIHAFYNLSLYLFLLPS